MKKVVNIILKVLLSAILLMPILGAFGVFPEPTADMYGSPEAFAFIQSLMDSGYIMIINSVVFILAFVLLWAKREALAALLLLPITVNIVAFHLFLDGGLLTAGAAMGNLLLVLNLYFMWQYRSQYAGLLSKSN